MDCLNTEKHIVSWLKEKLTDTGQKGFVVGVSGGIDSAVVSTLCARTGHPTLLVSIPIGNQNTTLADKHIKELMEQYSNVKTKTINLGSVLTASLEAFFPGIDYIHISEIDKYNLMSANIQSRLRMCALYAYANRKKYLVVGTGNKVEDFGIGFCTKGGDQMVDISPIGDLLKSEVYKLADFLGIDSEIRKAAPTDGLWEDGRTDEDQIGATYDELEWAMRCEDHMEEGIYNPESEGYEKEGLTPRQQEVRQIYKQRHEANKHKMVPPPVCTIPIHLKFEQEQNIDAISTIKKQDRASLDVDPQKGFTPLCPDELPVPDGHRIVDALNEQAKDVKIRVASKDWHPANALWIATKEKPQFTAIFDQPNMDIHWKAHCIAGTVGAEFLDGLPRPEEYDFVVYKGMEPNMHPYGACYHDLEEKRSTGLIEYLQSQKIKEVIIGGLAADYCVKTTAIQLSKHFKVYVNLAACRAISEGKRLEAALSEMTSHGITLLNRDKFQLQHLAESLEELKCRS